MKPLTALKKMRLLITPIDNWIKQHSAEDANGRLVNNIKSKEAVRFCLWGSLVRVIPKGQSESEVVWLLSNSIKKLFPRIESPSIICFNDDPATKHSEVLRVIDHTIKSLVKKEKV